MKRNCRPYSSEFSANLINIVEHELKDNPHNRFSYYSLSKHINQKYKESIGHACIHNRVAKLQEKGKVFVRVDPDRRSRMIIQWIADYK